MRPRSTPRPRLSHRTPIDTSYCHFIKPGMFRNRTGGTRAGRTSHGKEHELPDGASPIVTTGQLEEALRGIAQIWAEPKPNATKVLRICNGIIEPFFTRQRFNGIAGRRFIRTYGPQTIAILFKKPRDPGARVVEKIHRYLKILRDDANQADSWMEKMRYQDSLAKAPPNALTTEELGVILDIAAFLKSGDAEIRSTAAGLLIAIYVTGNLSIPKRLAQEIAPILQRNPTQFADYDPERLFKVLIPEKIRRELEQALRKGTA